MMAVIAELTDVQKEIVATLREFGEKEVIPVANDLKHRDEYPAEIVEKMKEIGLFGLKIPEEYGGLGEPLTTYALVVIELARGWMSLSGILNTHFIAAWQLENFGTEEQKQKFLPRMATGEIRAALSMTEPHAGSDSQAIRCKAIRDGDVYRVTGTKMWVTNGLRSGIVMLMCKTDPDAEPPRKGIAMLMLSAAQKKDSGERSDLEAGMAKLFAAEMCVEVTTEALRIHGGYGYSKEFVVERLYRDAPFLIVGEGTSEIQKMIIGRQLLERYKI